MSDFFVHDLKDRARWFQSLAISEGSLGSPIDINIKQAVPLELNPLEWFNMDRPCKKIKVTNSGHTLILSAKWHEERPYVAGGPLQGKYVFSQLHFHWGSHDREGSEHAAEGSRYPLEMHVLYFNSIYRNQEDALKENDGTVVMVYLFTVQIRDNPAIKSLTDSVIFIQKSHCSARLDPKALDFLVTPFVNDYFVYWGSATTTTCVHVIMWMICRQCLGISSGQMDAFRTLLDVNEEAIIRNFRNVQPRGSRRLFHINAGGSKYTTLIPLPQSVTVSTRAKDITAEEEIERQHNF